MWSLIMVPGTRAIQGKARVVAFAAGGKAGGLRGEAESILLGLKTRSARAASSSPKELNLGGGDLQEAKELAASDAENRLGQIQIAMITLSGTWEGALAVGVFRAGVG